MLINDVDQFVKTHFVSEAELEGVVHRFSEQLFGSSSIYLPQARLTTIGGRGTIPDAVVLDVEREEWFLVEAERAAHGTWEHIAPQVSRQLAAVASPTSREVILRLALDTISQSQDLRRIFAELGITDLDIHGRLDRILHKPPTIAIPIDAIPKDLQEWAQTLRNAVKIWVIEKFVSIKDGARILYSIPDENVPTLRTAPVEDGSSTAVRASGSQLWRELLDAVPALEGQTVYLEYGPRGGERKTFQGTIRQDGVEVDGEVYSPSYAAVLCMRKAGSRRETANGWVMWKNQDGEFLTDLYEKNVNPRDRQPI
jgi:hypothetical protein